MSYCVLTDNWNYGTARMRVKDRWKGRAHLGRSTPHEEPRRHGVGGNRLAPLDVVGRRGPIGPLLVFPFLAPFILAPQALFTKLS